MENRDRCSHCGAFWHGIKTPLSGDLLCRVCQEYFADLDPEDKARLRRRIEDLLRKPPSGRIKWEDLL